MHQLTSGTKNIHNEIFTLEKEVVGGEVEGVFLISESKL